MKISKNQLLFLFFIPIVFSIIYYQVGDGNANGNGARALQQLLEVFVKTI